MNYRIINEQNNLRFYSIYFSFSQWQYNTINKIGNREMKERLPLRTTIERLHNMGDKVCGETV